MHKIIMILRDLAQLEIVSMLVVFSGFGLFLMSISGSDIILNYIGLFCTAVNGIFLAGICIVIFLGKYNKEEVNDECVEILAKD